MSETVNVLNMLIFLNNKKNVKISDIAEGIEVSPRTVRRYKEILEQAGMYIHSETGKYGGYTLYNHNNLLGLNLTHNEYLTLKIVNQHIQDTGHIANKEFKNLVSKIELVRNRSTDEKLEVNYLAKQAYPNSDRNYESKNSMLIYEAILRSNKIKMKYQSLTSGISERKVQPYLLFDYMGESYFAAFCEKRSKVLDFKISRILNIEVLKENFEKQEVDMDKLMMKNCIGIYKDEELYVKLKIFFPMSQIIKEKIWVSNQKITECGNDSIIYEAKIRGLTQIKSWVLGMGSYVQVLEPNKLVREIKGEIRKIKNLYL